MAPPCVCDYDASADTLDAQQRCSMLLRVSPRCVRRTNTTNILTFSYFFDKRFDFALSSAFLAVCFLDRIMTGKNEIQGTIKEVDGIRILEEFRSYLLSWKIPNSRNSCMYPKNSVIPNSRKISIPKLQYYRRKKIREWPLPSPYNPIWQWSKLSMFYLPTFWNQVAFR